MTKSKQGISLIVLVITIIVLTILVVVTISLGKSGKTLEHAEKATLQLDVRTIKEQVEIEKIKLAAELKRGVSILKEGEGKSLEEISSIMELPKKAIEKYGQKLIFGRRTGDTEKLYYDSARFTDERQRKWLEEIGVEAWLDITDKYTISNLAELERFRDEVNNGIFTGNKGDNTAYLIADIDMAAQSNWIPIGNVEDKPFEGIFKGNGYKIKNISIISDSPRTGFFGYNKGEISDIVVESGTIIASKVDVGAICGSNMGTILNCVNKATVTNNVTEGDSATTGGIVGVASLDSTIKNCINYGNITGNYKLIGGICGYNFGVISDCFNVGRIESTTSGQVGGITGDSESETAIIAKCYNTGTIIGDYQIGGICGCLYGGKVIQNYNKGMVIGVNTVGGVCGGVLNQGTLEQSFNYGNVKGTNWVGGVTGGMQEVSQMKNCYNVGSVMGDTRTGGVTGLLWDSSSVINCFNVGMVSGSEKGSIVGRFNGSTIQNTYYSEGTYISGSLGTIKTENEMKTQVVDLLNSSETVWKNDINNINHGYPILSWQTEDANIYDKQTYMPNMIGITAYCDSKQYENGSEWINDAGFNNVKIQGNAIKSPDGSIVLSGGSSSYANIDVGKTDNRTIYVVAKCNNETTDSWDPIFTSGITNDGWYNGLDIFSYNNKIAGSAIVGDVVSEKSSMDYKVIALVSDAYNSKYKLYINGEYIGEQQAYHSYRNNMMYLNAVYRNGMTYSANSISYKFIAVYGIMQTEEEIVQNSRWLINKYNIK